MDDQGNDPEGDRDELERLRAHDRWMDVLLVSTAHDLRSPLGLVRVIAETLRDDDTLPDDQRREMLGVIATTAGRLARLLGDVVELDDLTRHVVTPELAPVDLVALVREEVQPLLEVGVPVEVDAPPDLVLDADAPRLRRAIGHLLDNAVGHTPPGTPVRVHLERLPTHVRLVVEDDGPGIPAAVAGRLFEPFVSHPAHDTDRSGPGVGLSLVRLLAELHRGEVAWRDRAGGGAVLEVRLPVAAS